MYLLTLIGIVLPILLALAISSPASAHCIVGNRFFPATLIVDDPCVNDELSFGRLSLVRFVIAGLLALLVALRYLKPLLPTLNWFAMRRISSEKTN